MTLARLLCATIVAIALAGCSTEATQNQARSALGGAAVSGVLGSKIGDDNPQLATTATGSLLSPFHGSEVGKALDPADRRSAEDVAEKSLGTDPTGSTAHWRNAQTGHAGTFTPINVYVSDDGLTCRDYDQSVTVNEATEDGYGTACLAEDGSWRVVETPLRRALRHRR